MGKLKNKGENLLSPPLVHFRGLSSPLGSLSLAPVLQLFLDQESIQDGGSSRKQRNFQCLLPNIRRLSNLR